MATREAHNSFPERNARIAETVKLGVSYALVGLTYNISRERVRQIVRAVERRKAQPVSTSSDVVKQQCGYCCSPAVGCRLAYLKPSPRERYDHPTLLCPGCRRCLRGQFVYAKVKGGT